MLSAFEPEDLRVLVKEMPVGACLVGPDNKFLDCNPEYERITGYTRAELLELTWMDITPPGDREADRRMVEEILAGKRETYQMRKTYNRKFNGLAYVLLTVTAKRDDAGNVRSFLVTAVRQEPKVQVAKSDGHFTVSSESGVSVVKKNWRWLIVITVAAVGGVVSWLAAVEVTMSRAEENAAKIERLTELVQELLKQGGG